MHWFVELFCRLISLLADLMISHITVIAPSIPINSQNRLCDSVHLKYQNNTTI